MKNSGLVLFMCAGLLLSGGIILCGSTTWTLLRISYYFWTTDLSVELASAVTFVAGALLCLPTCWLATLLPYHPRSPPLFTALLCVAMAALLTLSIGQCSLTGLTRALRDPGAINASMHRAMSMEPLDPAVRSAFAAMQLELRCCGVHNYTDWYKHRTSLPPSCCGRLSKRDPKCEPGVGERHRVGCLRVAMLELRNFANTLSALSLAIIVVLAVTMFAQTYALASSVVARQKPAPATLRVAYLAAPPAPLPAPPAPFPLYPADLPLPVSARAPAAHHLPIAP